MPKRVSTYYSGIMLQVQKSIQSKARLQTTTDDQIGPGNLFAQPRRKKKRVPRKANPIQVDSDDEDEPGALGGAGLP
eukprot:COSAG02_NODE_1489_length_12365_cov_22.798793_3_plen_77_part_00